MHTVLPLPEAALLYDLSVVTPYALRLKGVETYPLYFRAVKKAYSDGDSLRLSPLLKYDYAFPTTDGVVLIAITSYKHASQKVYVHRPTGLAAADRLLSETRIDLADTLVPLRRNLRAFVKNSVPFTAKVHRVTGTIPVTTFRLLSEHALVIFMQQSGIRFYLPEDFPTNDSETVLFYRSAHTALTSFMRGSNTLFTVRNSSTFFTPLDDMTYYRLQQHYFFAIYERVKASWNGKGSVG